MHHHYIRLLPWGLLRTQSPFLPLHLQEYPLQIPFAFASFASQLDVEPQFSPGGLLK